VSLRATKSAFLSYHLACWAGLLYTPALFAGDGAIAVPQSGRNLILAEQTLGQLRTERSPVPLRKRWVEISPALLKRDALD